MPELQWGFPTQSTNNQFVGLNNAGAQAYVDDSISSIVREAIQNSLDAAISPQGEVGINIAYGVMKREVHENIFDTILSIRTHIEWCRDEYRSLGQNHNSEVSYFDRMLERIERFNQLGRIPFLKIKDMGTIGMYHNAENPRTGRLCTFIQGDGVNNANNQNGGGANGIGKMAYFAMSPLNMVLVSTCAIENSDADRTTAQTFFSGSTKLTTHSNPNNPQEQYQYAGYLPTIPQNSIFEPLCGDDIDNALPFILTRRPQINAVSELGTTIYIIGCEPNGLDNTNLENYESELLQKANDIYGEMAKAVLKNYWLAIYRGRLKIELGTSNPQNIALKINQGNINRQLGNYFQEDHFGRQFRNYNPLHFVKALNPDGGLNISQYELNLDTSPELRRDKTWGKVRLYVNIDDTLQGNMIIAMRSPMMTVWRYKADTNAGSYAAVLVCDEEGNYCNELLRLAEPHTHDKWESAQVGQHGGNINDARALLTVINQWVNQVINELFANTNSETGRFLGMSEYLCFYNPEDASLRDSNLNKGNAMSGETSTIEIRKRKKNEPKGTKVSSIYTSATTPTADDGPSTTGGDGNETSNKDGEGPGYTNPNTKVKETSDGHQTSIVEEVNIKVRYFVQKESNNTWKYVVILNGNQDYKKIALRFEEQKENSSSEKNYLQISKITEGCIHKKDNTKVHSISLEANTPKRIEVEFKMNTRRIALKVTSTLYNTTEEETE